MNRLSEHMHISYFRSVGSGPTLVEISVKFLLSSCHSVYFFMFIAKGKVPTFYLPIASCFQIFQFRFVSLHCFSFRFTSDFSWFALMRKEAKYT
jgi:hypothetical protein